MYRRCTFKSSEKAAKSRLLALSATQERAKIVLDARDAAQSSAGH
jgi:hypothetical protein